MTHNEPGPGSLALVIGASGSIGSALLAQLQTDTDWTLSMGLSRRSVPPLDLLDEASIAAAAAHIKTVMAQQQLCLRLVINATGVLHTPYYKPEKSLKHIDVTQISQSFAINAIGPALLMKHFIPLMPCRGPVTFATLSAKVGSIGDNRLGGWYSYRASKAALNQLVKTVSIEMRRCARESVCVALHPGTVDSPLSAPFAKTGLSVRTPKAAAADLLAVVKQLQPEDSGNFLNYDGAVLPW